MKEYCRAGFTSPLPALLINTQSCKEIIKSLAVTDESVLQCFFFLVWTRCHSRTFQLCQAIPPGLGSSPGALTACCACTLVLTSWIMRVFCVLAKLYLCVIHPCTLYRLHGPWGLQLKVNPLRGFLTSWHCEIALLLILLLTYSGSLWLYISLQPDRAVLSLWGDRLCNSSSVLITVT